MALAVFRSCVMSRIAMGVTGKLKATCLKKAAYNKFGDQDVLGCPGQFEGQEFYEEYDEEEFGDLYAPGYDSDEEERKERVLDWMYYDSIADWIPKDHPVVRPGAKFKYVSPGVYLHFPRPPVGRGDFSCDPQPPCLVRVRGNYAISDDGCTVFSVPRHHYEQG